MLDLSDADSPRQEAFLEDSDVSLDRIAVSRDGAIAAYQSNESGTNEVYVRGFPEPGERTLVSRGGGRSLFWAPDGRTLYYWTQTNAFTRHFMAARIQRTPTAVLFRDTLFTGSYYTGDSDLHPDGDRLVVPQDAIVAQDSAEVLERFVVAVNWFEELKERVGN